MAIIRQAGLLALLKLQLGPRWSIDDEDWEEESEGEEDSVSRTASSSQGGS